MTLTATDRDRCEPGLPGVPGALADRACPGCGRAFPTVAGLPDLRVASDRFLDLAGERAKAERLAAIAPGVDLEGLAEAYYAMTPDVEPRRRGFYLGHILGAEARGSALAGLLPRERADPRGRLRDRAASWRRRRRSGWTIEGTDIALRWLVVARRRLDDRGLSVPLVAASADRLPYPDASFDAVVADSVLEHLDDPAAAVREWARVLRPGGTLLVWSPNRYALTVDPHVRLWGLGWLPRALDAGLRPMAAGRRLAPALPLARRGPADGLRRGLRGDRGRAAGHPRGLGPEPARLAASADRRL